MVDFVLDLDQNEDASFVAIDSPGLVRSARAQLKVDHDDAIAWMDLALGLSSIGKVNQAQRAVEIALGLAPHNRHILRSGARFYVHTGQPHRAHRLLAKDPATPSDPWLMAAEIATASIAERASQSYKSAQRLLTDQNFSPWHLNELAAAVGSLEASSGNLRKARKLFKSALRDASDNTVAQVRWENKKGLGLDVPSQALQVSRGFEARAWTLLQEANWVNAANEAEYWLADEPFSSRPATLGSFVAATALEDYPRSIAIARKGRLANPSDPSLANNLATHLP